MNGVYLRLWLNEVRWLLENQMINNVTGADRLIQIHLPHKSLFVSLYPAIPAAYVAESQNAGTPLKNWTDDLRGFIISTVEQSRWEPVFSLLLKRKGNAGMETARLMVYLHAPAPNLVFTAGTARRLYPRLLAPQVKRPLEELKADVLTGPECAADLVRRYDGLDRNLAAELTPARLDLLKSILSGAKFRPRLVSRTPMRFSVFTGDCLREDESFNALFQYTVELFLHQRQEAAVAGDKKNRLQKLRRTLEKLTREMNDQNRLEEIKIMGELLLANLRAVVKNKNQVTLFNPYTGQDISIRLNPALTPQQNAQVYFKEYKRRKRSRPKIQQRIQAIEKQISQIERSIPIESSGTLHIASLKRLPPRAVPWREFTLGSGSIVLVGKSARGNDELTFSAARPNDYFFHARGVEGAHTLLKTRLPRGQRPSHEDIYAAAAIAAYYSKARNQRKVPVSYACRKYIKKNKKGKPGSVILMREEVIFVNPALPESKSY